MGEYSITLHEKQYGVLYSTGDPTLERRAILKGLRDELKDLGLALVEIDTAGALDDGVYIVEIANT